MLLQNHAHFDAKDRKRKSSLLLASQSGHTATVSLLLQAAPYAAVEPENEQDYVNVFRNEKIPIYKNEAGVDSEDLSGMSSLMLASDTGHTETVTLLLQKGANVNKKRKDG